jgi:ribosomal protein L29
MAKSISETMDDLRQDVVRWKAELSHLRAQGVTPHIEKVEKFIADAETVLSRWENPN